MRTQSWAVQPGTEETGRGKHTAGAPMPSSLSTLEVERDPALDVRPFSLTPRTS